MRISTEMHFDRIFPPGAAILDQRDKSTPCGLSRRCLQDLLIRFQQDCDRIVQA
ncbi:hypothetical protein DNTS_031541 [Danionella cerebrum]|uniref:Uncharacterized protein n=1 Tax=Danionella cerebrum TaxID=2873325 RepID=A0A553R2U4_9TELE|nr:hypothetical protein DNTS_031541 [Danionella translucida]